MSTITDTQWAWYDMGVQQERARILEIVSDLTRLPQHTLTSYQRELIELITRKDNA